MKLIAFSIVLLALAGGQAFGVVLSFVPAPQDDLSVLGPCNSNVCQHPEWQPLSQKYNELLSVRFFPLKEADIDTVFGPKLDKKPDDFVKPLFVPPVLMESGLGYSDAANKRHIDFHNLGDLGYLEVHYGYDGDSVGTCIIYLRADAGFVPLKSTNDIPAREAWDNAKYAKLQGWLNDHMPRITDLGKVDVSTNHTTRLNLGEGTVCILTTRDIHCDNVPYWLSIDLAKDTADQSERIKSTQYKSVDRLNEPLGFTVDGKFYRLVPKLVDAFR